MLTELFKTQKRIDILNYVLYNDGTNVTEISRQTKVSKGLVSRFMGYLENFDLIEKTKRKYYKKNTEKTKIIKTLLNLEKLNINTKNIQWADTIGVYGSWASGTNTSESDLDVWVKVKEYPSEYEISKLQKNLRKTALSEVNILILTPKKLKTLKDTDMPFYNSIHKNTIYVKGESLE
jgi:predicted nucleotidyltransferase